MKTNRKGNIFHPGEEVLLELPVESGSRTLEVVLRDFNGSEVFRRTWNVSKGVASVSFRAPERKGVYFLNCTLKNGEAKVLKEYDARVGVITRSEVTVPPEESPFGTCVISDHRLINFPGDDYSLVDAAGIRWFRPIITWDSVEPEKGVFHWENYDRKIEELHAHGMGIAPLIGLVPKWASSCPKEKMEEKFRDTMLWTRYPPKDMKDYENFIFEVVNRYKDRVKYWIIMNEPNMRSDWPGWDPETYVEVLKAAYTGAKRADPESKIVLAGLAFMDLEYYRGIYEAGGKDYFDVMDLHPYCFPAPPESHNGSEPLRIGTGIWASFEGLRDLKKLMAEYGDGNKPVWITELTWLALPKGESLENIQPGHLKHLLVTEEIQAYYIIRANVLALAWGAERIFMLSIPDIPDPVFTYNGLALSNLTPKPSYVAYCDMASLLTDATFQCGIDFGDEQLHGYIFKRQNESIVVLWTLAGEKEVILNLKEIGLSPTSRIELNDMYGNKVEIQVTDETVQLTLKDAPLYLVASERRTKP